MRLCLWLALALLAGGCVDLARPTQSQVTDDALAPADIGPDTPTPSFDLADEAPETAGERTDADSAAEPEVEPSDAAESDTTPADLPVEVPRLSNGEACLDGDDCRSGSCSDGVCCNNACTSACQACNLVGFAGTCSPIPAGEDPASDCAQDPPQTCGRDGTCDGSGGCRRHPAGTICGPGSCTGVTEQAASTCDNEGFCQPGAAKSCAPNVCMGGSCASKCAGPTDCQAGFFCDVDTCRPKRTAGGSCTAAVQCVSGFCADGVCCNSACGQTCSACNLVGAVGTCTAITDGQDPANECPAQAASTCGRVGGCNGAGACRLQPPTTLCAPAACSGSTATPAGQCNGNGACVTPAAVNCGTYLCSGPACGTSCTSSSQCSAGAVCVASKCVACTPESNATFCARLGAACGQVTGNDNCGSARTVTSCGGCAAPQTCGGGGTANVCGGGSSGACAAAYAQANCVGYTVGVKVSRNGHNWTCSNGNCSNCATNANCAPGGSGCPWGVVWTDNGSCS